jgi:Tol biopolymer transport system component
VYQSPRLSPDGRTIAVGIAEGAEFGDVWMHDLSTGATLRLTTDRRSGTPLWTPNGSGLVYSTLHSTGRNLMRLRLGNTPAHEPIPLPTGFLSGAGKWPESWMDEGQTLLVEQQGLPSEPAVWSVALDGSRKPRAALPGELSRANHSRVSPDGRWMAYESGTPQADVFVAPLQGGPPFWKVSSDGGVLPVWSRDGRELFYRRGDRMMAVTVAPGETFRSSAPRQLFEGRYFEAEPGAPNYDVTPDGQRFLMVLPGDTDGPDRLNVIQGWKAEVLRRLRDRS